MRRPDDGWTNATTDIGEHLAYLHGATARIGGGLELDQVVHALCDTAVPEIADLTAVYLCETVLTEGELPGTPLPAETVLRRAAVADRGGWSARALADKVAVADIKDPFATEMTASRLPAGRHGGRPSQAAAGGGEPGGAGVDCVLAEPWPGAILVVPLRLDRLVLGFALLLRTRDRDRFDDVDVMTATLMADQAALGIHKAILYQREAQIADELQRSMLPKRPPRLPGIDIAHRYLPGYPGAQVGGDWFDAIPLAGSRVALVVGDVMGHGVKSAAAMGQLHIATRTLATLDPPPDQVLRQLDQLFNDRAEQLDEHYLATCIYCVYDPVARRCAIANAGHVPPVFIHPDGRTELIHLPPGAPVGVGGVAFQTVEMAAPDGALLALCTDGLVESPERDLNDGLAMLRDSVRDAAKTYLGTASGTAPGTAPGTGADATGTGTGTGTGTSAAAAPLEDLCEQILRDLHLDDREDDLALLVARFGGIPSANVANWILRPHPQTPYRARRLVAATMSGWGLTGQISTMELLVTELVTNAIRYATRPIAVRLLRTETSLMCEVTDDDHNPPVLCEPTARGESGRGVYLVSRFARRWGTSLTPTGKSVWCELAIP